MWMPDLLNVRINSGHRCRVALLLPHFASWSVTQFSTLLPTSRFLQYLGFESSCTWRCVHRVPLSSPGGSSLISRLPTRIHTLSYSDLLFHTHTSSLWPDTEQRTISSNTSSAQASTVDANAIMNLIDDGSITNSSSPLIPTTRLLLVTDLSASPFGVVLPWFRPRLSKLRNDGYGQFEIHN